MTAASFVAAMAALLAGLFLGLAVYLYARRSALSPEYYRFLVSNVRAFLIGVLIFVVVIFIVNGAVL